MINKDKEGKLNQRMLKELLQYNPQTGKLFWLISPTSNVKAGSLAGCSSKGYRIIKINHEIYQEHRVCWLYETGSWPDGQIDHINHDSSDNRIKNLRVVTSQENSKNKKMAKNNTSGVMGVGWDWSRRKWRASIKVKGRQITLGRFDDMATAVWVRQMTELRYGFHENHGCPEQPITHLTAANSPKSEVMA